LIAIRYFKDTAVYSADDMVIEAGVVYKAKADITTPGAFDPTEWDDITSGSGGSSLWSEDGTTRLFPTQDHDRTDINVQGNVDLGGTFNIEAVGATTDDMIVSGSDVSAANGTYTHTGTNLWNNGSYDIRMEGEYNWVVDVAGNTGWSTILAYKQSNLTVPNGNYTGYNGHSDLVVADVSGTIYGDALATKGSAYMSGTVKTGSKFLVGSNVTLGKTPDEGPETH
jgi:hypothetical protein